MSTETTSSVVDNSVTFSETLPDYLEEDTVRGKKNVITICNGTDMTVYAELHPIELVRRLNGRQKKFGFGVQAAPLQGAGGANVEVHQCMPLRKFSIKQVELGEVEHEKEVLDTRKQTVHPHSTSNIIIPKDHISKLHPENAALLHNSILLWSAF